MYNFGLALAFIVLGSLSLYGAGTSHRKNLIEAPVFGPEVRSTIEREVANEALRNNALFYFDTARDMRKARNSDTERWFDEIGTFCFVIAALFLLSGALALLLEREGEGALPAARANRRAALRN
ncbi:MAG TPA: hypothetical protein VIV54_11045 [Burkholderiales bacterium]